MTILLTSLLLAALPVPPQFVLDAIDGATVYAKRECIWRGERSTCLAVTHKDVPYSLVLNSSSELRYILTIRDGKIVEVWAYNSKVT